MNNVSIMGRLTRDPETRRTENSQVTSISVACDRKFKQDNQPSADFISCKAFGKTAEFIEKYFNKGMKIGITGRIQTGQYKNKDGITVYTTDVVVENVEFVESKNNSSSSNNAQAESTLPDFMNIDSEEELPFS